MGEEEERRMIGLNYCSGSGSGCCLMDCSNIGYKLLKKQGWVEGTGLGASLQGRVEPVETHLKKNKKGIGAEKKPKTLKTTTSHRHIHNKEPMSKREKAISKRMRKMVEEEKRRQEKEFDQAFFREFWPDNV